MVLTYKLVADISSLPGIEDTQLWEELKQFALSAPDKMHACVEGNHFFFLDEKGASKTAEKISHLVQNARDLEAEFSTLVEPARSKPDSYIT